MSVASSVRLWARAVFRRGSVEEDLEREIRFHLEMEAEKYRAEGMSGAEAARRALISFGGVERYREAVRDERGVRFAEDFVKDLRYGLRGLRRAPGLSAAAVLVLGLGIGSATAMSTTVDHVLRQSLPFRDAARLVFVTEATGQGRAMLTSFPNFEDWRRRARSFSAMTAFTPVGSAPVVLPQSSLRARVQAVSRGFFDVFGVRPVVGRLMRGDENGPGAPPVAVVSESFWRTSLGGQRDLSRVSLKLGGTLFGIVGVMPSSFRVLEPADIWIAGETDPVEVRGAGNYWVVGRLRPGVSVDAARRELNGLAAALKHQYGEASVSSSVFAVPLLGRVVGDARRPLVLLLVAAIFVLVATCASVAMMQLSRVGSRQREIGIRAALGAGRLRLARQAITEQLVLAGLGCGAGLLAAWLAVAAVRRYGAGVIPRIDDLAVSPRMLGTALAATAVAVILFGAAPVLQLLRRSSHVLSGSVRASGTQRRGGANALLAAQAAVSVLLVVGAALLVRSIHNLLTDDLGYDRSGLVTVDVGLTGPRYQQPSARLATLERLRETLAGIPGVDRIALTSALPFETGGYRGPILVPPFGDPATQSSWSDIAALRIISPDYFRVIHTPLLRGRMLGAADRGSARAVVINQSLATHLWPGADPIGKSLRALADGRNDTLSVVGVVADAHDWTTTGARQPELYLTLLQRPEDSWRMNAVLHTPADPRAVLREIPRRVRAVDPEIAPVVHTLDDVLAASIADRRFVTGVLLAFALVVLTLTMGGIAGSIAYSVHRRTAELGIRMAMGATRPDIWLLVQRGVLAAAALGAALGLLAALEIGRLLSGLLYAMTPRDPTALATGIAVTLLGVSAAAAIPALRAARIDPAAAVRVE